MFKVQIYFVESLWDDDNFGEEKTIESVVSYDDNRDGGHVHIETVDGAHYEYEGWEIDYIRINPT